MKLYKRYEDTARALQQRDVHRSQPVTRWWRRSWEGVLARSWKDSTTSCFPPFGIAEWLAFAPHPAPRPKPGEPFRSLEQRFEQDLLETWDAWRELIDDSDPRIVRALHPHLVPPRACWLKQPSFEPGTPALGFF